MVAEHDVVKPDWTFRVSGRRCLATGAFGSLSSSSGLPRGGLLTKQEVPRSVPVHTICGLSQPHTRLLWLISEAPGSSFIPQTPPLTAPWPFLLSQPSANCHQLARLPSRDAAGCLHLEADSGWPNAGGIGIASPREGWGDIPGRPGGKVRWGERPRRLGEGPGGHQGFPFYSHRPFFIVVVLDEVGDSLSPPSPARGIWQGLEIFLVVTASKRRGEATGTQSVEAADAAKHPARHSTASTTKDYLVHSVNSAEVERPHFREKRLGLAGTVGSSGFSFVWGVIVLRAPGQPSLPLLGPHGELLSLSTGSHPDLHSPGGGQFLQPADIIC
ncbi:uncharacterized protein LOC124512262 [Lynx rufus]|uniref:uncharacterized protein LOC124512262 n=1 Tax=Lynx rufus TaxID=61384 RepID=UPI001F1233AC|nr:uncharacterized protein LOC124512262 [Lynx rufus]